MTPRRAYSTNLGTALVWSGEAPEPGTEEVLDRIEVPRLPERGTQLMLEIEAGRMNLSIVGIAELDKAIAAALGEG